ncbi:omega-hydroxyceramide transacylase-like isoform X2 [Tympanuchus pallidicinctus]|uniref:omega-hydroxyceramide transacylase-like isoform X2 n=1 Tax=Tympanuchus pallidicinctus TaxID=109042 RepID=UPI002287167D|nr:omega-hydroxyceramide transacylase-like isoform X2 [Tympanuchus pallidicinctus]
MNMKGDERPFSLMFRGCSFLQVYEAGVVKALQDLAPEILKSASKIYGISSGSIVAAFAACECDIGEMQQYLHSAGKLFFTTLLTARGKVLLVVKEALSKFLPANAHQLASGKLHIILTRLRDWNCVTVSEFASKEDIIQAVLCSCFIPLCFGFIPPLYHGVRYIDGEFGMWKTNLVSQTTITVSALAGEFDICPRDCPVPFFVFQIVDWVLHVSEQNLYRVQCLFQCPSAKVCEQLYHDGYQDAVSFLHRLNAFGIKFLPENFTLSLHKESCQKGEGTLHRKPGTGVPCSRATDSQDITKENAASICSAGELEEEDISTSCNPQKDQHWQLVWLQEDL